MTRKIGLDVVRAGAISLVLVAHLASQLEFCGLYGVELFFALSGFLIGGILFRRLTACPRWTFGEVKLFWSRRWWRTLPNYYLFLMVSLPLHYYIGGLPTLIGIIPFFVFCQDLLSAHSTFYGVSWSLCIEEWFYLLFPLCILVFVLLGLSKRNAFICATVLFLVFPPTLREWMFAHHDPAIVRKLTLPRLDAIFYGVATSFVVARYRLSPLLKRVSLAAAVIGLVTLFIFQHHCHQTNVWVPFYRAAFVLLPLCFSLSLPYFGSLDHLPAWCAFLTRPITNLSLWSYSIYLSHIPILFLTYAAFGSLRNHASINLFSKLVGLAACLGISSLVYAYYESKLMVLRPAENHSA